MATPKKRNANVEGMLSVLHSPEFSTEIKADSIKTWANSEDPNIQAAFPIVIAKVLSAPSSEKTAELQKQLEEMIGDIMAGPQKEGAYLGSVKGPMGVPRALIEVDGGDRGYCSVLDGELARNLKVGDVVQVSMRAGAVTGMGINETFVGEQVSFTRRIDADRVEVRTRGDEKRIIRLAQELKDQVLDGKVKPGAQLVMNRGGTLARQHVIETDGMAHYRFLERVPVPDVMVERDIGAPPRCIEEIADILRVELTHPEVRRKYRLRRCITKLLAGVSGSGKTLAIQAIWRRMYEIMADVTGKPIEDLPHRVFWLRPGRLLSKWFGESEQLIEQAFDEVQCLAEEKFTTHCGREINLPVLVVIEEIDGIARSRGDNDQVYGRVLTTLLQRLDPSQPALGNKLVVFIGTTNESGYVDRAFLRRIGGTVEKFGRLDRGGFVLVLDKHLRDLPLSGHSSQPVLRRRYAERLADWLFDVEHDPGIVQILIGGKEARCNRSDFLTGGLIDRAVQQSASQASDIEAQHKGDGITLQALAQSLEDQLRMIGDQLTTENLGKYMTLPDGARATKLQRIPAQPLPVLTV